MLFTDLGIDPDALRVARKRFPFVYTGLRGNNTFKTPPWAIRRDAVQPYDSLNLIGTLLEGGADIQYSSSLKTYENWNLEDNNVQ